ncbi:hypothetical protein FHS04_000218 [Mesoflavibacter sabulilitoris]|uniref:Lipoprotein n=1 Tax=Mesoflavibacter zeaxanthinifaciens subsp. sabulilitoris TaxID=1520893 RepID=A0A2T1NH55_9FLAO|nr:hypothetical protein [Mesoflavibacter zeaxanthinifaciens]MBB3122730.1 hypothetical protein [Mesoflavibacter zeaxanthinifaciens subsp. sabulilitoris]PSG92183.1 hypothetical protein C7H61_06295 [Mesoflavibacter zeaxanthinifaciens subsp. sabulilitoris]
MKRLILLVLVIVFACKSSDSRKLIYDRKTPNINNKLKLDGFYYNEVEEKGRVFYNEEYGDGGIYKSEVILLKKIRGVYLSKDGSIRLSDGPMSGVYKSDYLDKCGIDYNNNTETAIAFFGCSLNTPISESFKNHEYFSKRHYEIYGDSIKIQYYFTNHSFYLAEKKGIILNDTTFKFVEYYDNKTKKIKIIDELYKFKGFKVKN